VNIWRNKCFSKNASAPERKIGRGFEVHVRDIREIKITVRDAEVLKLLVQGCSNKEIASQLKISPRTVKQHLRTMFLRAGIRDGRKRVKLATAMFQKEQMDSCNRVNS
jgi:DNA-binding NarL/FixJ family response regulator